MGGVLPGGVDEFRQVVMWSRLGNVALSHGNCL